MSSSNVMPVIFVGHGSPMNIIDDNAFTQAFQKIGQTLPKPKAILAVSAHWLARGTHIQRTVKPKTIYDFSGFPEPLYQVQYPVDGSPSISKLVSEHSPNITETEDWGIDHGTWSVLVHMFPKHDIPVLQMSINVGLDFKDHMAVGKELKFLREQGVLILASGNIVHNLRQITWDRDAKPFDWNIEFDQKITEYVTKQKFSGLYEIAKNDSTLFKMAHPTYDHYLPLLYAAGAANEDKPVEIVSQGYQNASISMTSFLFN